MNQPTRPSTRRRIVTPAQVLVAGIPVLLIIVTPLLPFAREPVLIAGIPSVIVWMAVLVAGIVIILQIIDRQISAREDALAAAEPDSAGHPQSPGPAEDEHRTAAPPEEDPL